MNYRPEIDGLRAIAVVPVILFHGGFSFFGGGFVGVDVFFVISGYLITTLILTERENGTFSLMRFYERRVRRILPALYAVLFFCLAAGFFLLLPFEYGSLARSAIAVTLFVSNFLFWLQSGYFDTASEEKPLLHTWSLAVEEQYYLFFPIFMLLFWFAGKRIMIGLIAVGLLISLGLAHSGGNLTVHYPFIEQYPTFTNVADWGFYLIPSRAWELLAGSLIAFLMLAKPDMKGNDFLAGLGLVLIGYAVFAFDRHTPFPSLFGVVPVVGTLLVIVFASGETFVKRALSFRAMVGIGLISYSAYLWHQPLFAFARTVSMGHPSAAVIIALILVTFGLAWLSWRFVEQPFRKKGGFTGKQVGLMALGATLLAIGVSYTVHRTDGLLARYSAADRKIVSLNLTEMGRYNDGVFESLVNRAFVDDHRRKVVLVGDSFAADLANALNEADMLQYVQLLTYKLPSGCGILLSDTIPEFIQEKTKNRNCGNLKKFDSPELRSLLTEADAIVLAGSWKPQDVFLLPESLKNLEQAVNTEIVVVGTKDFGDISFRKLISTDAAQRASYRQPLETEVARLNQKLRELVTGHAFVDLLNFFCNANKDCRVFTDDGDLISWDGGHLTPAGARFLGERLARAPLLHNIFANKPIDDPL